MIRQLPVSPSRDRPSQFSTEMDELLAALPGFVDDCNALEGTLQLVATTGTSTTTLTVGNGSKSLVTQPGKAWIVGAVLYVVDPSAPGNIMQGQLTAYDTGTGDLTINVQTFTGSGSRSTWVIGLSGVNVGAASTGANTFTGAQTLPGNAVNALEAVPLQQLDDRLRFVSMPPAASTNSFLDFSGLPTWAKRISIQVKDFLTVGNDPLLVQLQGASGGLLSDGYSSTVASVNGFDSSEIFDSTTRIMVPYTWTQAGANRTGIISLTKMPDGSWIIGGCVRANRASDKSVWTLAGVTPVVPGHLAIIRVYTNPESIVGGTVSLLIEG